MFDSPLVQIALGIMMIFVLFSLLVSSLQELGVALFKSRGAALWDSVEMLLGGGAQAQAARERLYAHPLIRSIIPPSSWSNFKPGIGRRTGPSYIPARVFAVALIDVLRAPHAALAQLEAQLTRGLSDLRAGDPEASARMVAQIGAALEALPADSPIGAEVRPRLQLLQRKLSEPGAPEQYAAAVQTFIGLLPEQWTSAIRHSAGEISAELEGTIRTLAADAAGGLDDLRRAIEQWFDQGMSSVSGWYKRWTMAVQLGLGLALALTLNIDTVNIVRELSANDALRRSLAAQADAAARQPVPVGQAAGEGVSSTPLAISAQSVQALTGSGVPIGWHDGALYKAQYGSASALMLTIVGWLLTAIAGSLGAPFWFDLLKRVANLRASGPNPAERGPSPATPSAA